MAGRTAGEAVVASLRRRITGIPDEDFHARTAERYVRALGRSKGVLMKAGQILSFVTVDAIGTEENRTVYQTALSRLQDSAPPMPAETAMAVVEEELGGSPEKLFAEFENEPLAAASIGQVHAARLHDGRRVAVKVQYPGVEEAIRADLRNTELLATFFALGRSLAPHLTRVDVRALAREVAARIGEEIDYRVEATNQRDFADAYRGHPFIRIPEVISELSARRVLTMDLADGLRWAEAQRADADLRDRWGETIFRFSLGGLRRVRMFNGDPHPGNYLFNADGTVTFLDFGSVKRFSPDQTASMVRIVQATVDGDAEGLVKAFGTAGFFATDDAPAPEELLSWFRIQLAPVLSPQPFTYTRELAEGIVRSEFSPVGEFSGVTRRISLPPDFLLLTRIDLGVTAILAGLGSTGPWAAIREEWDCGGPPANELGRLDQEHWTTRKVPS
jgi:predicted unusual protein kinase regulating ubiquinone biosynthesis (AarF/ABC1/UbiB family)